MGCSSPRCLGAPQKGHTYIIVLLGSSEHGKKFCSMLCLEEYVKTIPGEWHACSDHFVTSDNKASKWWHVLFPQKIVHEVEIEKRRDKNPREVREAGSEKKL